MNQNGLSQTDELSSLPDAGIAAIVVAKTQNSVVLPNGNQIADLGGYLRTDGGSGGMGTAAGQLGDINLAENTFLSRYADTLPLTAQAQALPDMQGSGRLRSLREAASQSAVLADLLVQFGQAASAAGQKALLPALLDAWADTSGMSECLDDRDPAYLIRYESFGNLRRDNHLVAGGGYVAVRDVDNPGLDPEFRDAIAQWNRTIHTLEAFNGRYFFNLPNQSPAGGAINGLRAVADGTLAVNYMSSQLDFLQRAYDALADSVYGALVLQTRLRPYLDAIQLTVADTGIRLDFSAMNQVLRDAATADPYGGIVDMMDLQNHGAALLGPTWSGTSLLVETLARFPRADYPELYARLGAEQGLVSGTAGADVLGGVIDIARSRRWRDGGCANDELRRAA